MFKRQPHSQPNPQSHALPYLPPQSRDFEITTEIREAGKSLVPPVVFDRYRGRVVDEVFTGNLSALQYTLRDCANNDRFMAAYFHPTEDLTKCVSNPFGPTPAELQEVQLDDRPFELARDIAKKVATVFEMRDHERGMASVIAFLYCSSMLFNVGVMKRAEVHLSRFISTKFCHDHNSYLRSVFVHEPLKALWERDQALAYYLGSALDERNIFSTTSERQQEQMARLSSVLFWSNSLLFMALRNEELSRPYVPKPVDTAIETIPLPWAKPPSRATRRRR